LLLLVESQVVLRECPPDATPESRESLEETECHVIPVVAVEDGVVELDPEEVLLDVHPPLLPRSKESLVEAASDEKNCCIKGGFGDVLTLNVEDDVTVSVLDFV